jgi:hypothetical protein
MINQKLETKGQAWWNTPAMPALRRWRQEAWKFKATLGYVVRPCLKEKQVHSTHTHADVHAHAHTQHTHANTRMHTTHACRNTCNTCTHTHTEIHATHMHTHNTHMHTHTGREHNESYQTLFEKVGEERGTVKEYNGVNLFKVHCPQLYNCHNEAPWHY